MTGTAFHLGAKVVDLDGFNGIIVGVTNHNGAVWYDVRFDRGIAIRFPYELKLTA